MNKFTGSTLARFIRSASSGMQPALDVNDLAACYVFMNLGDLNCRVCNKAFWIPKIEAPMASASWCHALSEALRRSGWDVTYEIELGSGELVLVCDSCRACAQPNNNKTMFKCR